MNHHARMGRSISLASPAARSPNLSRHRRQASGRIRHELQVDERRLDRRVAKPPAEVVDRDPVYQQVTGVAVSERMVRYVMSRRYGVQFLGPSGRSLYPPVCRGPRCPDEPVELAHVAELERAREGGVQLGVNRYNPSLAALALANAYGGTVGVQRQVPCLDRKRLGDPEPGPPLDEEQQPRRGFGAARISASTPCASRYSGSCCAAFSCGSRRGFGC